MTTPWMDDPAMDSPGDAADQAQVLQFHQEREAIRASLAADARRVEHLVDEDLPRLMSHGDDLDMEQGPQPWDEPPLAADPEADASDDPFHGGGEDVGFEHPGPRGMHIE